MTGGDLPLEPPNEKQTFGALVLPFTLAEFEYLASSTPGLLEPSLVVFGCRGENETSVHMDQKHP